jgi:hypothetical protein
MRNMSRATGHSPLVTVFMPPTTCAAVECCEVRKEKTPIRECALERERYNRNVRQEEPNWPPPEPLDVKLECAAHHEAGHIVVAVAQGLKLRPEGIVLDSCGEGLACYCRKPDGSDILRERIIVATFAGFYAEMRFRQERGYAIADAEHWFYYSCDGREASGLPKRNINRKPIERKRPCDPIQTPWSIEGASRAPLGRCQIACDCLACQRLRGLEASQKRNEIIERQNRKVSRRRRNGQGVGTAQPYRNL